MPSRRASYPVLPVFTAEDWMSADTMTKQKVNNKTAAVRLCRNLGYRVLTVGGMVDLITVRIDGEESEAWAVTVHPEV
jgi:hypothetical protein